jgi:hypothetical protein
MVTSPSTGVRIAQMFQSNMFVNAIMLPLLLLHSRGQVDRVQLFR